MKNDTNFFKREKINIFYNRMNANQKHCPNLVQSLNYFHYLIKIKRLNRGIILVIFLKSHDLKIFVN